MKVVRPDKMNNEDSSPLLFFMHIPKTGGTSLRKALELEFSKEKIIYDYGQLSSETTPIVKKLLYQNSPDFYALQQEVIKNNIKVIGGHVSLMRFLPFVEIKNTIVLMRNPIKQVISHYNHYVLHHDFKGNLREFIEKPGILNCQSRMLNQIPIELIGNVGRTEDFSGSIELINQRYGINLPLLRLNQKNSDQVVVHEKTRQLIRRLSQADIMLYRKTKVILARQNEILSQQLPWVYGVVLINDNLVLHGVAYYTNSENPVTLEVFYGKKKLGETLAVNYYRHWAFLNLPRNNYVGFNFPLSQIDPEKLNWIDVQVKETGQSIVYDGLGLKK